MDWEFCAICSVEGHIVSVVACQAIVLTPSGQKTCVGISVLTLVEVYTVLLM